MFIDLKQLFDVVGDYKRIDYNLDAAAYKLSDDYPFKAPIHVLGEIRNKVGIVTLKVNVSAPIDLTCDRCLESFGLDYDEDFEHFLVRRLNGQSDDYIVVENARLDLDDLILTDILLSFPTKILCDEDCQGLCIQCGHNLNIDSCECEKLQ